MDNSLKDNLVAYSKIAVKSSLKFTLLFVCGLLFSLVAILISAYLISNDEGGGMPVARAGVMGALLALWFLFVAEFWTYLLLFSSILVFPLLYFKIASQTAVQRAISSAWKNRLGGFVTSKVDTYLQKLETKQPDWLKNSSNIALLKTKMVEMSQMDSEVPKIQKKAFAFLLKKIKLDGIDFQDNFKLSQIITDKINETVTSRLEVSNRPYWIIVGIHFCLIILALVFDNH